MMRRLALIALLAFATPSQAFEMPEDQAAADFVAANVISTFYHELGHGLIDVLQLAVLGREEDAADTLSAVLMHQVWDEESATTLVYGTANAFWLYASEAEQAGYETAYWDEHSLDMQRYYNLVCLFYGANPEMRDDDITELELPEDRAERCPDEYALAEESWGAMLDGLEPTKASKGLVMNGDTSDPLVGILDEEVKTMNAAYGLPEEISVQVAECGEANAFYDPSEKSITFCSEYADDLLRLWEAQE
jgi:hypothetical protein